MRVFNGLTLFFIVHGFSQVWSVGSSFRNLPMLRVYCLEDNQFETEHIFAAYGL